MKVFRFDQKDLKFKEIKYFTSIKRIILLLLIGGIFLGLNRAPVKVVEKTGFESVYLIEKENEFSEDLFIQKLKNLNIKFPHIALAQAKQETGNFTSNIFISNHNLFGMKEAKTRITLAKGTQFGHAYYNKWQDSVLDYGYWLAYYASKCKNEKEMYDLLGKIYAEDPDYVSHLKRIIKNENLKELF